jgi:hypothetical protein
MPLYPPVYSTTWYDVRTYDKKEFFVKHSSRLLFLTPFLTLLMLLVAFASPLMANAASAHSIHSLGIKTGGAVSLASSNMSYHGGSVETGTTDLYAIFWEPTGSTVSSTYNSLILRYFGDIGSSGLYANDSQYTQTGGGHTSNAVLGGSWVDTASYPSGTLSDAQIQAEVTHAKQVKGWTSSIDHVFFVFTAKGENICVSGSCSFSSFCAYHSYFGSNTLYAAMPYTGTNLSACGVSTSPNNNFAADSTINVTSHEENEAATDPLLNAWYDGSGNEIGDKCAWIFGATNSNGGDVTWNGHTYEVQKEWDNKVSGCVLTGP